MELERAAVVAAGKYSTAVMPLRMHQLHSHNESNHPWQTTVTSQQDVFISKDIVKLVMQPRAGALAGLSTPVFQECLAALGASPNQPFCLVQVSAILLLAVSTLVWLAYQKLAQRPTYLVDYVVHRPDPR